jgi:hypothetical protein
MKRNTTLHDLVCCPHCLDDYSLREARLCYKYRVKDYDDILLVSLCKSCRKELKQKKNHICQNARLRISKNLFSNPERLLSVTSEIAMMMHDYNLFNALKYGHGLNRVAYDAVKKGDYYKCSYAQHGLIMMWTAK